MIGPNHHDDPAMSWGVSDVEIGTRKWGFNEAKCGMNRKIMVNCWEKYGDFMIHGMDRKGNKWWFDGDSPSGHD